MEHLSLHQLARTLGVCRSTLHGWLTENCLLSLGVRVPCGKGGKKIVFDEQACLLIKEKRDQALTRSYQRIKQGDRYGRLTITGDAIAKKSPRRNSRSSTHRWYFPCLCDCGNSHTASMLDLIYGDTRSCGCLGREIQSSANTTHGQAKIGKKTRLYRIWIALRSRCNNANTPDYQDYGGRGIFVCDEWNDYLVFQKWSLENGYAKHLSIDRIDVDLPYHPENCRWATPVEQANNKRTNVVIEAFGEEKTLAQWTKDPRCAVCYSTLQQRITKWFWEPERAISTPPTQTAGSPSYGGGRPRVNPL